MTAEEFFRNKIKEQNPNREVITLSQELITAEQGMRWAHEFKQLALYNFMPRYFVDLRIEHSKLVKKHSDNINSLIKDLESNLIYYGDVEDELKRLKKYL